MRLLFSFLALLALAWFVDDFQNTVRSKVMERQDLSEIEVRKLHNRPLIEAIINTCPNELGKLQVFLDCREEILKKMNRNDI